MIDQSQTDLLILVFQIWICTCVHLLLYITVAAYSSEIGNPITDDIKKISLLVRAWTFLSLQCHGFFFFLLSFFFERQQQWLIYQCSRGKELKFISCVLERKPQTYGSKYDNRVVYMKQMLFCRQTASLVSLKIIGLKGLLSLSLCLNM